MSDNETERRATLSAADIAALVDHHRLAIAAGSPLAAQPAVPERTGRASLEGRRLLGGDWSEALTVLAAPVRQVRAQVPGPDAALTTILYGSHGQGWVGCWGDGGGLQVTFPWSADRILAMGYQVLMATEPPPPDGLSLSLSLPGLTALVSAIDALRALLFRSYLNRQTGVAPLLTRAELASHLEGGLLHADGRWAVSLLDAAGSPHFPLAPQELPAGVEELERLGLLAPAGEGWEAAPSLQRLALLWRSVLPAFALESLVVSDDGALRQYGHRLVIRGDGPLCQIEFGAEAWQATPRVTLRDTGPMDCFNGLQALLAGPPAVPQKTPPPPEEVAPVPTAERSRAAGTPAAAKAYCPHCGQPRGEKARFCGHCGGVLP